MKNLEKIIYLVGLPGSGKTELGKKMASKDPIIHFIDDPSVAYKAQKQVDFLKCIPEDTKTVIIADPTLVCSSPEELVSLNKITLPSVSTNFICFENDPEACWTNINKRNETDFRKISTHYMKFLSETYAKNYPLLINEVPVYKPKKKLTSKIA